MTPAQVTVNNPEVVWNTLLSSADVPERRAVVFTEGDRVRVGQAKPTFKKGYIPSWIEELFTVSRVKNTNLITYVLKDDSGEELKGSFK
jgi:hypothetical protein